MDKVIEVYDNVLDRPYMELLYPRCKTRSYNIGWGDPNEFSIPRGTSLYSRIENDELLDFGFLNKINNKDLLEKIDGREPIESVINCTTYSDVYLPHTHSNTDVLLCYVNLEWRQEWWGESEFYSDDLKETILTNQYVPGRVVWFDGDIPHSIRPQSRIATKFRMTLSLFYISKR